MSFKTWWPALDLLTGVNIARMILGNLSDHHRDKFPNRCLASLNLAMQLDIDYREARHSAIVRPPLLRLQAEQSN